MSELFCISKIYIYTGLVGFISLCYIIKYILKCQDDKKYKKFENIPNDTVLLHHFPIVNFPSNISSPQPWVLKIKLFCKLAQISYIKEFSEPWGPKGKSPWITLNGEHMGDSQLIIEFLEKKFNVSNNILYGSYKDDHLAVARAVRVMLEERFFWAMPLWRFIWDDGKKLFYRDWTCVLVHLPIFYFYSVWLFRLVYRHFLREQTISHGIGRHSKVDTINMLSGDLKTVSKILGNKKYILGDQICIEDCAIFGIIVQAVYGMPDSPYDKLIIQELPNLKQYCDRIKEEYFPEWKS